MIHHFPKELPATRQQQEEATTFIENATKAGVKVVVLEMPVGSGKSGVAMTVSRYFGGGIVATPTIALQAQYLKDFKDTAPLIGRGRFPCLKKDENAFKSIPIIQKGTIPPKPLFEMSCAVGPCLNRPMSKRLRIKEECEALGGCPHQHSLDVAQRSETVVANLHSLMYAVSINETVSPRKALIIDEAHDLQKFMRDFLKVKFKVRRIVPDSEIKDLKTVEQWLNWLQRPEQLALLITEEARDSYKERLERLEKIGEAVFEYWPDPDDGELWVELTPVNIANACQSMLFSLADVIVLMSGTIYSKEMFLRPLGVSLDNAAFLRIDSDFPVQNRQVVLPRNPGLDLSHKSWKANLPIALAEIKNIIDHHKDYKGLIHTSSYRMSQEVVEGLQGYKVISHESFDFQDKLKEFYESEESCVFISPVCAQGVDFKNDLARWQIIIRPQFASITDPYVKYLLDKNWWQIYYYQAAIVFGQQLGRIVRSKEDCGITYLLSSSFTGLINKTNHLLPGWLKKGFVR